MSAMLANVWAWSGATMRGTLCLSAFRLGPMALIIRSYFVDPFR